MIVTTDGVDIDKTISADAVDTSAPAVDTATAIATVTTDRTNASMSKSFRVVRVIYFSHLISTVSIK